MFIVIVTGTSFSIYITVILKLLLQDAILEGFERVMEVKSEYFLSLSSETRERYARKVVSAGLSVDPYSISEWEEDPQDIPSVTWSDMVYYMTNTPSPYTREELKVAIAVYSCTIHQWLCILLANTCRWIIFKSFN